MGNGFLVLRRSTAKVTSDNVQLFEAAHQLQRASDEAGQSGPSLVYAFYRRRSMCFGLLGKR
jgi:hypothetical protein